MQELRAFVEEGRIVFVALEDEVFSFAELKAAAEVFRDAADQKRRLQSSSLKDPRQHRRRSRLAVGSCHHQHFFSQQKLIVQNLRQRGERDALIEHIFQFGVAARNRIAHDHQIRLGVKVR